LLLFFCNPFLFHSVFSLWLLTVLIQWSFHRRSALVDFRPSLYQNDVYYRVASVFDYHLLAAIIFGIFCCVS
jgi:hypothetical protein